MNVDISSQYLAALAKAEAVRKFAQTNMGRAFMAPCLNGTLAVTESAKRPGLWQLTFFDRAGEPCYDSQEPSYESCVKYAFGQWRGRLDQVNFIPWRKS